MAYLGNVVKVGRAQYVLAKLCIYVQYLLAWLSKGYEKMEGM